MNINQEIVEELVKKAQAGDVDSFSELYEELLNPLYRFCYFRLPNKETAEDITSEVFLNIWDNLNSYKKQGSIHFTTWAFRIAQNKIIDFFRKNKEHLELKEELEIPDPHSESAKRNIDNEVLRNQLKKALKVLPETQSQSLILKFFSELDNKEIAEIMDKSETAVRILQSRGLKTIRKYLPQFEQEK